MDAKELLARIEKLPEEWRHPKAVVVCHALANNIVGRFMSDEDAVAIALDLHLRHIAEKLAERGWMIYLGAERWNVCDDTDDFVLNRNTYVEAAISAAEECNKQ